MNFIEEQQREAATKWSMELLNRTDGKQPQLGKISLWNAMLLAVSDQLTKQTITNTLNHILESGLLEERDLEEIEKECIAKGVQSGKQKRAISIAFGSNAKARDIKEFISNMDKV